MYICEVTYHILIYPTNFFNDFLSDMKKGYLLWMFGTLFSQPISLVFRAQVFQIAKRCVFFAKKILYESCLKNQINLFLKK